MEGTGMAELIGTEKQVKWAESIRREVMILVEQYLEKETAYEGYAPDRVTKAIRILNQIASAAWWIDHRDLRAGSIPGLLSYAVRSGDIKSYFEGGAYFRRGF